MVKMIDKNSSIGIAGEYFVAAELTRRGHVASLTSKNTKAIDILASNKDGSKSVAVQVKTSNCVKINKWMMTEGSEKISSENLFYIFVNMNEGQMPSYFIIPSVYVANKIKNEYLHLTAQLGIEDVTCFPLSAKVGDNVVEKSNKTPWFEGTSLLQYLETVPIDRDRNMNDFRFPVQYVLRPNLDFRGFSGKVASGIIRKGDTVMALPSKKTSRVKSIVTYEGELDYAFCPQCVTITLEDEIDISRGEMLVKPDNLPFIGRNIQTKLVWMDEEPMNRNKQFFLKIGTNTTRATINAVDYRIDINTMDQLEGKDFCLNEIGQVQITTAKTLFFDDYKQNRATGAFILIDPITNNTCAVGMIEKPINEEELLSEDLPTLDLKKLGIAPEHHEAIELAAKELSRQGIEIIIKK